MFIKFDFTQLSVPALPADWTLFHVGQVRVNFCVCPWLRVLWGALGPVSDHNSAVLGAGPGHSTRGPALSPGQLPSILS